MERSSYLSNLRELGDAMAKSHLLAAVYKFVVQICALGNMESVPSFSTLLLPCSERQTVVQCVTVLNYQGQLYDSANRRDVSKIGQTTSKNELEPETHDCHGSNFQKHTYAYPGECLCVGS